MVGRARHSVGAEMKWRIENGAQRATPLPVGYCVSSVPSPAAQIRAAADLLL